MTALVIQSGKHKGTRLTLPDKDIIIGRDKGCGIRLASSDVSRQHCRLRWQAGCLHVSDLGSQNGTLVNDQSLTSEVQLQIGDRLQIATMVFVMTATATADSKTQAPQQASKAKKPAASKNKLTDDDIADWLEQEELDDAEPGSATMIMPRFVSIDSDGTDGDPTLQLSTSERKSFDSVSEEAQDIIKRHLAAKGTPPPSTGS